MSERQPMTTVGAVSLRALGFAFASWTGANRSRKMYSEKLGRLRLP